MITLHSHIILSRLLIIKLRLHTALEVFVNGCQISAYSADLLAGLVVKPVQSSILAFKVVAVLNMALLFGVDSWLAFKLHVVLVQLSNVVLHLAIQLFKLPILSSQLLRKDLLVLYGDQVILDATLRLLRSQYSVSSCK